MLKKPLRSRPYERLRDALLVDSTELHEEAEVEGFLADNDTNAHYLWRKFSPTGNVRGADGVAQYFVQSREAYYVGVALTMTVAFSFILFQPTRLIPALADPTIETCYLIGIMVSCRWQHAAGFALACSLLPDSALAKDIVGLLTCSWPGMPNFQKGEDTKVVQVRMLLERLLTNEWFGDRNHHREVLFRRAGYAAAAFMFAGLQTLCSPEELLSSLYMVGAVGASSLGSQAVLGAAFGQALWSGVPPGVYVELQREISERSKDRWQGYCFPGRYLLPIVASLFISITSLMYMSHGLPLAFFACLMHWHVRVSFGVVVDESWGAFDGQIWFAIN